MMPSTGVIHDENVASIWFGRAIQKMIVANRGNIPANSASRQPMGGIVCRRCPGRHPPDRVMPRSPAVRCHTRIALHQKLVEDIAPLVLSPIYAQPGEAAHAPQHRMPEDQRAPETAYQIVHDE